jgi:hypothetical protein
MEDVYEHIVVSPEAKRRIKLFSAKYGIPMKVIIDWFIFSLLDENGDPQIESLIEAMPEIQKLTKELTREELKEK